MAVCPGEIQAEGKCIGLWSQAPEALTAFAILGSQWEEGGMCVCVQNTIIISSPWMRKWRLRDVM